jgi:hypothetical protein
LQGKKPPEKRFLELLRAKRNKLPAAKLTGALLRLKGRIYGFRKFATNHTNLTNPVRKPPEPKEI